MTAQRIGGRYLVEGELGRGGMGVVFAVRDEATGQKLALKRMHTTEDPQSRPDHGALHFRREFHTLARLAHPHIVAVHDFGIDGDLPYYTMELLEGGDLRSVVRAPVRQCCQWLRDVASALAFLHARRLLHRDLKSRNVRRTANGRAKLIDFGVLATVGVAGDVAGTPSSIAPESVRGLPLDARADLFGLGALAYWLLTGQHAYPAQSLEELPERWTQRPVPPSTMRGDVPDALDALVLAMLSIEPAARPRSAAEVIDRLSVIADLDPGPSEAVSRGWLASADLVGRDEELARIRGAIADVARGRGGTLLVSAPSGAGKTRLLREAGLEAQLTGAMVLRAAGRDGGSGYDVMRQLVLAVDAGSRRAAAADASSPLRRVFPELGPSVGTPAGDPMEERLRVQRGLLQWFRAIADTRAVVVLVDELQRVDEPSLAALAALARESNGRWRFGIVAAQRTDEVARSDAALAAVTQQADTIALHGLSQAGVRALVHALFGEVPRADDLATWMHAAAGGSPLLCMELAHHLVDTGAIRYAQGTWLLPAEEHLEDASAPRALADAMDRRIAGLSAGARKLAEALAILGARASLAVLAAIAQDDERSMFAAVDELVEHEVLVGDDEGFELYYDGLRDALRRGMDDDRRRSLHRLAAQALQDSARDDPDAASDIAIGWHWFRGGERERGAEILERAAKRQYHAQAFVEAIPALQAALTVYEEREPGSKRCLSLRQMLMRAGVVSDREVVRRYADATIAALRQQSGLQTAARVGKWLGHRIGLFVGLVWAWLCFRFFARERFAPLDALARFVALVNYTASVYSLAYATTELRPLRRAMRPLRGLKGRIPYAATLVVENFLLIAQGHWRRLHANAEIAVDLLHRDRRTPLPEIDRRFGHGAVHYMQASALALDQDPAFESHVAELESLDLRFFDAAAHTARYIFHELRGEALQAESIAEKSRTYAVQLGNTWVFESQRAWISAMAHATTRDIVGLKRDIDELERMSAMGFRFAGFAAFARAEYLRECGDPNAALEVVDAAIAAAEPDHLLLRQLLDAARVEALLDAGKVEAAIAAADAALAPAPHGEPGLSTLRMRLRLVRARAEIRNDAVAIARTEIDALAADAKRIGSPVLLAAIDEARAELAARTGEDHDASRFRGEAAARLRGTGNPVLVARAEQLASIDTVSLPPGASDSFASEDAPTIVVRDDEASTGRATQTRTL